MIEISIARAIKFFTPILRKHLIRFLYLRSILGSKHAANSNNRSDYTNTRKLNQQTGSVSKIASC